MAQGKRRDPDAQQRADVDPLKIALEKGRAEREAQEAVGEFRRLLSQAASFSNPGPTWGTDYTKPVDYEREGLLRPSHEKWPEANEEFSRQWVGLWRQVADAARKAGLSDRIRALEPATSVMRPGPEHIRPLIGEMHGLFVRVLVGDAKVAAKVAHELASLRARCEPTPDEMKRGNVLMNRRWDAGKYFSWLRSETGRWATRPTAVDRAYATGLVRDHCLVEGVSENVARALVDMMCVLGVVQESSIGVVEIPGKPGVLGNRPEESGAALKHLLSGWITSSPAFALLGRLVLGSGHVGMGMRTGGSRSSPRERVADLRDSLKRTQEALDAITYDPTAIIERMGQSVASQAEIVVGAILERLEREARALGAALRETELAASAAQESLPESSKENVSESKASDTPADPTVASDCSWICAGGTTFEFKKRNQRPVVSALYQEWLRAGKRDGCGLGEDALMDARGVRVDRVRMDRLFKKHPALETLIRRTGPRLWALYLNDPFGPGTDRPAE